MQVGSEADPPVAPMNSLSLLERQKMYQGWDHVVRGRWRNSDRLRVSEGESTKMRGEHEGSKRAND